MLLPRAVHARSGVKLSVVSVGIYVYMYVCAMQNDKNTDLSKKYCIKGDEKRDLSLTY